MPTVPINFGPCKNNVSGLWHYCQVYGMNTSHQQIHPIGRCRENNKKDATPCEHKTEAEAILCYKNFEFEQYVTGAPGFFLKDILFPDHILQRLTELAVPIKAMEDERKS